MRLHATVLAFMAIASLATVGCATTDPSTDTIPSSEQLGSVSQAAKAAPPRQPTNRRECKSDCFDWMEESAKTLCGRGGPGFSSCIGLIISETDRCLADCNRRFPALEGEEDDDVIVAPTPDDVFGEVAQ